MKLVFEDNNLCRSLFGEREVHLRILEEVVGVSIHTKGNEVTISGPQERPELAEKILQQLYQTIKKGRLLSPDDIRHGARSLLANRGVNLTDIFTDVLLVSHRNRRITPKGYNQKKYIDAIRSNDLVFGIGPAGTGKTYLAMAMAIGALTRKEVSRIILTRPAVEAGERLGFLPGDLEAKVNPYLRPLYDALHDMVELEKAEQLIERGVVEVAPLAFMRGRTLNDSFIILDEAQNTSNDQMKMFLTRLGYSSKAVVTGDITQIDLPRGTRSGLLEARDILRNVPGIAFSFFDDGDVVRHHLVQRIIQAYAKADERGVTGKDPSLNRPSFNKERKEDPLSDSAKEENP